MRRSEQRQIMLDVIDDGRGRDLVVADEEADAVDADDAPRRGTGERLIVPDIALVVAERAGVRM